MSTCCHIEDVEDDATEDQPCFFSDDSDLELDIEKIEGALKRYGALFYSWSIKHNHGGFCCIDYLEAKSNQEAVHF